MPYTTPDPEVLVIQEVVQVYKCFDRQVLVVSCCCLSTRPFFGTGE